MLRAWKPVCDLSLVTQLYRQDKSSHECTRKNKMRINFFFLVLYFIFPKTCRTKLDFRMYRRPKLKPRKKTNRVSRVCKTFHTSFLLFALSPLSLLYLYETSLSITSVWIEGFRYTYAIHMQNEGRVKLFKENWPMLRKRTFLKNHTESTMDNGHIWWVKYKYLTCLNYWK